MKRLPFIAGAASAIAAAVPAAADPAPVVVFAAASLREAFESAAPDFTKKTGFAVRFAFGGSDTLVTQLAQGAPADVFASANEAQMKVAADAGLLAAAPRTLARNHLVAIVPQLNPARIAELADLAKPGVRVVLAEARVPVGTYARAAFRGLNGAPGYPADFAGMVERNVVSNELDVKAVATKISLGEGDAGVVYATDVTATIRERVKTIAFPSGAALVAVYPVAPLKHAQAGAGARAFVAFMLSPAGQAFLKARGFAGP